MNAIPISLPGDNATRATLVAKVKAADNAAWREFYDLYKPLVLVWARNVDSRLTRHDLDEVCQEVMTALSQNFSYDPEKGKLRTWLRCVVKNKAFDRVRKLRAVTVLDTAKHPIQDGLEREQNTEFDRQKVFAEHAMLELKRKLRPANWKIWMRIWKGDDLQTISDELNVPIGTIYTIKSRAVKDLRAIMEMPHWTSVTADSEDV